MSLFSRLDVLKGTKVTIPGVFFAVLSVPGTPVGFVRREYSYAERFCEFSAAFMGVPGISVRYLRPWYNNRGYGYNIPHSCPRPLRRVHLWRMW